MRTKGLTLPILISFNELAWIAVFFLVFIHASSRARSQQKIDELSREEHQASRGPVNQQLVGLKGKLQRVVIVVDRSGSMGLGRKWPDTRSVIETWIEHLPIRQCALLVFNDTVKTFPDEGTFLDLSGSQGRAHRAELIKELRSVTPSGNANALKALETAYAYPDLDTIILFTDGWPDTEPKMFDSKMAIKIYKLCKAHGSRVPINTVGLGSYFKKQPSAFVLRLPRETGGAFLGR